MTTKPASFKIANSECTFKKEGQSCQFRYTTEGICFLSHVLTQLVPTANIAVLTNNFIVPAKFNVQWMDVDTCAAEPTHGMVKFMARSTESVELVPQKLTLAAESRLIVSWNGNREIQADKLAVNLKGLTSIGELLIYNCFSSLIF